MGTKAFSVCVYCGSRPGLDPAYMDAAQDLGTALAAEGWRLVYGAGDVGLMGAVAEAATKGGGDTLGIIPAHLIRAEAPRGTGGTRIVTETMHERKKVMLMNADAVVMLPGGAGSLDEFFEALTWRQLGLHDKPIHLLNVADYWEPLIALLAQIVAEGFAGERLLDYVVLSEDVAELVDRLRS